MRRCDPILKLIPQGSRPGDRLSWDDLSDIRVMAVAEGYAMVRRPHCAPFIVTIAKTTDYEVAEPRP